MNRRGFLATTLVTATLAEETTTRLRDQPPPDARWALARGCGTTIEGEQDRGTGVLCGMGHVPLRSMRSLCFFLED